MKWVSIFRLRLALQVLAQWRAMNNSQGCMHLMHFLSAKANGVNTRDYVRHTEQDDANFCDRYLKLRPGKNPYYDPLEQEFRIYTHWHSNIATARKKTFADKWKAAEYRKAGTDETWRFNKDYLNKLITEMGKKGIYQKLPIYDLCAWFFKFEAFPDQASIEDVESKFIADFNISPQEKDALFQRESLVGQIETARTFFSKQTLEKTLVLDLVSNPTDFDLSEAINTAAAEGGKTRMSIPRVVDMIRDHKRRQIIFQGPPGTGKTLSARRVCAELLGITEDIVDDYHLDLTDGRSFMETLRWYEEGEKKGWTMVQFHPSYGYEDFVRGITPVITDDSIPKFKVADKVFSLACKIAAIAADAHPFILIIDEINRADLSKVFGELIYALEYRGKPVNTQYSRNDQAAIVVPENLVVIGTMNTADRSIAHIDYAIRRRFDFIDLPPDRAVIENHLAGCQTRSAALALFDAAKTILRDRPDQMVGHAYFLHKDAGSLANSFVFQVLPLLNDYKKEGVIDEDAFLTIPDWPGGGIPVRPDRPFEICPTLVEWIEGRDNSASE